MSIQRLLPSSLIAVGLLGLLVIFSPVTTSSATSPVGSTGKDTVGGTTVPAPQCQWQINGATSTPSMTNATKYTGSALTLTSGAVSASAKVIAVGSDSSAPCVWWSTTGQSASVSVSMASNIYTRNDYSAGIFSTSAIGHTNSDYGLYDANGYLSWVFKSPGNDLDVTATAGTDNTATCTYSPIGLSSTNAAGATLATIAKSGSQQGCSWSTVYSTQIPDQNTLFYGPSSHDGTGKQLDATFGAQSSVTLTGPLVTTTLSLS